MTNMPNIVPLEVVVVFAAVLLLCIAPALVLWSDARRRRRLEMQPTAPATNSIEPPPATSVEWVREGYEPSAAAPALDASMLSAEPFADASLPRVTETREIAEPLAGAGAAADSDAVSLAAPSVPEPADDVQRGEVPAPPAPAQAPGRYRFQLRDLRRARLRDWPPATVRNDPERNRIWHEAEQVADAHDSAIGSATLSSPFAAQSSCLGAAETDGSTLRMRFLLFPVLWPVGEDQALAEAVFEVDRAGGETRSWVQARR